MIDPMQICGGADQCLESCPDLEKACSDIIEILKSETRRSFDQCVSCLLKAFIEDQGAGEVMIYSYDDKETVFVRLRDFLFELRDDGGEAVPHAFLNEYLKDLEEFSLYPHETIEELKKWLGISQKFSEPSP